MNRDVEDKVATPSREIANIQSGTRSKERSTTLVSALPVPQRAPHTGTLPLGDLSIDCAVLEDGTRVLTQRGVFVSLGRHKNPTKGQASIDSRPAFLIAKNLDPFITPELRELWQPIPFRSQGGYKGNISFGYRAEILPHVCNVYIDADEAGALQESQKAIARRCRVLQRGFATVGILALVDEVTGYQEVRDKQALQKILAKYISPELMPYQAVFPSEFYEELFRLRGWRWRPMSVKRPILVGKLTNDLVYQRLAPGVLEALQELTPRNDQGRLQHHLHRHLTPEEGRVALERHLHTVTAFMRASSTWGGFKRLMERSLPRYNATLPLALRYDDEDED